MTYEFIFLNKYNLYDLLFIAVNYIFKKSVQFNFLRVKIHSQEKKDGNE